MFKSKRTQLKLHPLTGCLMDYRKLLDQLEPLDSVVMAQVDELLAKAEEGEGAVEEEVRRARKRALKRAVRER